MSLWTADELAAATGGQANRDFAATGVAIDSRTVAPGDLFVALRGPNHDAHRFVPDALAKGAAAALVDHAPDGLSPGAPLLKVGDTLEALTAIGDAARRRSRARIIGVTGSVGKTGTKEALRLALADQGVTHASASSFNNHWGVPLSLARMPRDAVFAVFELGMNHPGELDVLGRLVRPHIAIITTVEAAHLGYFASVEAIADAKAEIFAGVEPGGSAILNRDNPHFARLERAAHARSIERIIGFGAAEAAEARLLDCRIEASGSAVQASILGETVGYSLPVAGRHWVMNSLAVLAAVKALGADLETAAAALARMPGLPGRGLRRSLAWKGGSIELIDESYNANPASMRAAIAVLGATSPGPGGRRIAVLGEMRELGSEASRLHAELAAPLAASGIDLVFTVGEEMAHLQAALPPAMRGGHVARSSEMPALIDAVLRPGDVISVKGSLSIGMAVVVKHLLAAAEG
ncbi:MAG TPA: UDP-N-acetylmuramoylalanyl-D-glutamyl-2,6-diaminopimelate--D-alanyl-D-alanine ligase [Stellaceae bacterium]|nr:UDP-N-acetylmuramoylalanyl-D-glutamyl-2,6-diaminopimelate--D-alanyl-D-alanine ligase [Stellaceae bacterium]